MKLSLGLFRKSVNALIREIPRRHKQKGRGFEVGLKKAAEFLKDRSQEVVPVDTGRLHDSARVIMSGRYFKASSQVTYSTPYAIFVHEDLSLRHAPGKMAKYLEYPAMIYKDEMAAIIRREAEKAVASAARKRKMKKIKR